MLISVVICTHDRADHLERCLRSIAAANANDNANDWEILVVANACSDDTVARAGRMAPQFGERLRLVEFGEGEQCCGFGGTFSVSFPTISTNMGALKLDHVRAAKPDVLVSGDMSCMMHLGGLAQQEGKPIKTMHLAQVLRDALKNAGQP